MSVSLNVTAYSSKESKEFQKRFNAVKFCVENGLSFPKETSEFFKGKVCGSDSLEDFNTDRVLELIENGVEIPLKTTGDKWGNEIRIKVSEIPTSVDEIVVKLS
jgi:hypothetical protein